MRYLFGFICVLALGVMGCSETSGDGGDGGSAGMGGGGAGGEGGMGGQLVLDCRGLEDGTSCTVPGVGEGLCLAGVCKPVACDTEEDCDDKNDCTEDECSSTTRECVNEPVSDETQCAGGTCQSGVCELTGSVLPCTEQGIRNAIAAGGGPYTFECNGPTTVATEAIIIIDNNVTLDGEGNLTVNADFRDVVNFRYSHTVFSVAEGVTTELIGLKMTEGGFHEPCSVGDVCNGPGLTNDGALVLTNVELLENMAGIHSTGTLTLTNTTVSLNDAGIYSTGTLTLTNSTVSWPSGITNDAEGTVAVWNSTLAGEIFNGPNGAVTITNSLIAGECGCFNIHPTDPCDPTTSGGYNIESPGNTCGFDQTGDLVNITEGALELGELADNGGPTMTHALGAGSVAIDHIPAVDCGVTTDQRGEPRPVGDGCDVGSFEVQIEL
jgi:hypothetical protein